MSIKLKEQLCKELQEDLGEHSYHPCSGKKFVFQRVVYMDLVRMSRENLRIIQEISKDWEKVLEYNAKVEAYTGKIPDGMLKENCFKLVFDNHLSLCCYIDIELSDDTCIVFDVFQTLLGYKFNKNNL